MAVDNVGNGGRIGGDDGKWWLSIKEDEECERKDKSASNIELMKVWKAAARDIGHVRLDLQQVRDERDCQLPQVQDLSAEVFHTTSGVDSQQLKWLTLRQNQMSSRLARSTHENGANAILI
ncbi:hypothetical protein Tco_0578487 [Tanacetum coccineum]